MNKQDSEKSEALYRMYLHVFGRLILAAFDSTASGILTTLLNEFVEKKDTDALIVFTIACTDTDPRPFQEVIDLVKEKIGNETS